MLAPSHRINESSINSISALPRSTRTRGGMRAQHARADLTAAKRRRAALSGASGRARTRNSAGETTGQYSQSGRTEPEPIPPTSRPDNSQFGEEARAEAYRIESMQQLHRQSKAIESIRSYVAIWFWLTIIGGVLLMVLSTQASPGRPGQRAQCQTGGAADRHSPGDRRLRSEPGLQEATVAGS